MTEGIRIALIGAVAGLIGSIVGAGASAITSIYLHFTGQPVSYVVKIKTANIKNADSGGVARIVVVDNGNGAAVFEVKQKYNERVFRKGSITSDKYEDVSISSIDDVSIELLIVGAEAGWDFEWIEIYNTEEKSVFCLKKIDNDFLNDERPSIGKNEVEVSSDWCSKNQA
jgi:hypothetical protein